MGEGRGGREPSILHSAAGVMLGFLSRGCGERVSPSRGPVLNNKWPTKRQTGPRTPTPGGVAPTPRDKRRGEGGGRGRGCSRWSGGRGLSETSGVVVWNYTSACIFSKKKNASGGHARQSPGGAKQAKRSCGPSLREREEKERKIKLRAVQHFQRCQAR